MIRHTVVFRLRHPAGSAAEADFLRTRARAADADPRRRALRGAAPDGERRARTASRSRWSSPTRRRTPAYNAHPDHQAFVQGRWIPEVEEFLELDFEAYA